MGPLQRQKLILASALAQAIRDFCCKWALTLIFSFSFCHKKSEIKFWIDFYFDHSCKNSGTYCNLIYFGIQYEKLTEVLSSDLQGEGEICNFYIWPVHAYFLFVVFSFFQFDLKEKFFLLFSPVDDCRKGFKNNFFCDPPAIDPKLWIEMGEGVQWTNKPVSKKEKSQKYEKRDWIWSIAGGSRKKFINAPYQPDYWYNMIPTISINLKGSVTKNGNSGLILIFEK